MSYVQSITGDPINPNPFSYSILSISANTVLEWPSANTDTLYPATSWVDLTASVGSLTVTMPDARQVGTGEEVVFNNFGAQTVSILDAAGGSLTSITAGSTKRLWIVTNSIAAGTWRIANIGVGTSSADASALAGYGLVALAGQLSQSMPTIPYNVNTTLVVGNRAAMVVWTGGSGTFTLPTASVAGDNWFTIVKNAGSGTLTVASAQNIDGVASITATPETGFIVGCNGSTYYTVGKTAAAANTLTQLNKSVAGAVDVTLTAAEAAYSIINLTGAITANINVIVPATLMEWIFFNNTTGAFTVTVKTPSGTGIVITQGTRNLLYCDGTNVQRQDATASGTVTSITAGTGLTGGVITGSGTIGINTTAVVAGAYGAAMGVSSWTVNAQGQLTASAFTARSITGTANQIAVANGDGVAGAPTISLATNTALPGAPTAATAAPGTNTTQIASTAFVTAAVAAVPVPTFTGDVTNVGTVTTIKTNVALAGSPTTTTQASSDNSTKIATTAQVQAAVAASALLAAGSVGSYAMLVKTSSGAVAFGGTYTASSDLASCGLNGTPNTFVSGTWRCLGNSAGSGGANGVAIWQRIS